MYTLNSFVLQRKNEVISPQLVTIREYGKWLVKVFGEDVGNLELYLKCKDSGQTTLQYHPGTKIGKWFDKRTFNKPELHSWYIMQDSVMMDRLRSYKLAENKDAIPISVSDEEGRRMIRVYTIDQIELYVRSNIDQLFNIAPYITQPKQVKIRELDFNKLIMPQQKAKKRSLF